MEYLNMPFKGSDGLYHYTYIVKNEINGKYYKGVHSTKRLNDGYMGSGRLLLEDISKIGKEHFTKTI